MMNEQLMQEVLARIDALALKLGIAGEYLWEVMVRQQVMVNGYVALGLGVLLLGLFVLSLSSKALTYVNKGDASPIGVLAIAGWFCSIPAVIGIISGLCHLLNPAYYAFRAIIGG